jgi:hypothetical protein
MVKKFRVKTIAMWCPIMKIGVRWRHLSKVGVFMRIVKSYTNKN